MVVCGGRSGRRNTYGHVAEDKFVLPNPCLRLCLSFWGGSESLVTTEWSEVAGVWLLEL